MSYKPRLLIDFDGPIHRYSLGWHDGSAYDEPVEGAKEALQEFTNLGYEVVIFSTRDSRQIDSWLRANRFPPYYVTNEKLPCVAIVDDRAIRWINWRAAFQQVIAYEPVKKENELG